MTQTLVKKISVYFVVVKCRLKKTSFNWYQSSKYQPLYTNTVTELGQRWVVKCVIVSSATVPQMNQNVRMTLLLPRSCLRSCSASSVANSTRGNRMKIFVLDHNNSSSPESTTNIRTQHTPVVLLDGHWTPVVLLDKPRVTPWKKTGWLNTGSNSIPWSW